MVSTIALFCLASLSSLKPALMERARTVVTDGTGQYRIVDLRPGSYAVTFTLSGLDVYNALISNAVQTESNVYSTWRRPQSILVPRFAKFSVQFDF